MPEACARGHRAAMRPGSLLAGLVLVAASLPAAALVLTGEVRSEGAQVLYAPPSVSGNMVTLQYYVPDGTPVRAGEPVLRIDASQAANQLQSLEDQIEKARAGGAKALADQELARVDAELALVEARAAQRSAEVDAALPAQLVPAIDYDRYQGQLTSARRETALAEQRLVDARAAVARSREDGALELRKLEQQLDFNASQVETATVHAEFDGVVVHDFMTVSFNGQPLGRFEQGSNALSGMRVGEVVPPDSRYAVRAWVLASDRDELSPGAPVRLAFDALPGRFVDGRVAAIRGTADAKPEWGPGRYHEVEIDADAALQDLPLLPGMSVRVETGADADGARHAGRASARAAALQADGEIYARDSIAVMPPSVQRVWQFNITSMTGDGDAVTAGEPMVVLAASNIAQQLPGSRSRMQEAQRALEKLQLDLAEQARDADVATARAAADADKARRKAEQPEAYVPGVEYKKLVIDRERSEQALELTRKRTVVAARDRAAQLRQAEVEVEILRHEVDRLQEALDSLTLRAPRDGILLHRSDWNGEKYAVGSQIYRGTQIADIPDLATLAVAASLPEHALARVRPGQRVTVTLSGGIARRLRGVIRELGRSVHSRSRAEPEPVIDLDISLDADDLDGLKPGQQVQIMIHDDDAEAAA